MNNKKGDTVVSKTTAIILGVLVIILTISILIKFDVGSSLKNWLPDLSLPKEDVLINSGDTSFNPDSTTGNSACTGVSIGEIKKLSDWNYYIFLDDKNSNLTWHGSETTGYIIMLGETRIAEVKNKIISINEKYFNYDSDEFQKIRFVHGADLNVFAKLQGVYYFGGNQLCDPKKELPKVDYGWLEKQKLFELKSDGNQADFSPYITIPKDSVFKELNFLKREDYIEVDAKSSSGFTLFGRRFFSSDWNDIMRVYPDGSVWIQVNIPRAKLIQNIEWISRKDMSPFYETNLRINNYNEVYKKLG